MTTGESDDEICEKVLMKLVKFVVKENYIRKRLYDKHVIKAFLFQIESAVKVCPECGKTFKSKSGFSVHLRQHRQDPSYRCCEKEFYCSARFKRHRYFTVF